MDLMMRDHRGVVQGCRPPRRLGIPDVCSTTFNLAMMRLFVCFLIPLCCLMPFTICSLD